MEKGVDFVIRRLGPLSLELSQLLRTRFVPGERGKTSQIGRRLQSIFDLNNAGQELERDVEFMRLYFLAKHLKEVAEADPQTARSLAKRLLDTDLGNFLGARFEVYLGAALARQGIAFSFRSQGGPDFVVSKLGIECASRHLVDPRASEDPWRAVGSAVDAKSRKDYAQPENVLAIEVTNVQTWSHVHAHAPLIDGSHATHMLSLAQRSGFGALLLVWQEVDVVDDKVVGIQARYGTIASGRQTSGLNRFLSEHFPANEGRRKPVASAVPIVHP